MRNKGRRRSPLLFHHISTLQRPHQPSSTATLAAPAAEPGFGSALVWSEHLRLLLISFLRLPLPQLLEKGVERVRSAARGLWAVDPESRRAHASAVAYGSLVSTGGSGNPHTTFW